MESTLDTRWGLPTSLRCRVRELTWECQITTPPYPLISPSLKQRGAWTPTAEPDPGPRAPSDPGWKACLLGNRHDQVHLGVSGSYLPGVSKCALHPLICSNLDTSLHPTWESGPVFQSPCLGPPSTATTSSPGHLVRGGL